MDDLIARANKNRDRVREQSPLHADVLEMLKEQLLIVFLRRLGADHEVIKVPGGDKGPSGPGQIQGTSTGSNAQVATTGPGTAPPNPAFFLKPEEGTLTVDKAEGKVGSEATANIKVSPATGYHVSTDFPIKLTLDATPASRCKRPS